MIIIIIIGNFYKKVIFRRKELKCSTNLTKSNIQDIYNLADFITEDYGVKETRVIRNLRQDGKYCNLTKSYNYSKSHSFLTKT